MQPVSTIVWKLSPAIDRPGSRKIIGILTRVIRNKFGEGKWPWPYIIVNLRGEKEKALAYIGLLLL